MPSPLAKWASILSQTWLNTSVNSRWFSSENARASRFRVNPSTKYCVRSGRRTTPNWLKNASPPLSSRNTVSGQTLLDARPAALASAASVSKACASASSSARSCSGRSWKMRILSTIHSSEGLYKGLSTRWPRRAIAHSRVSAASKSGTISGPDRGDLPLGRSTVFAVRLVKVFLPGNGATGRVGSVRRPPCSASDQ